MVRLTKVSFVNSYPKKIDFYTRLYKNKWTILQWKFIGIQLITT